MLYYLEQRNSLDPGLFDRLSFFLPQERLERIQSYRTQEGKNSAILAYLLLRYGLFREFGITELPYIHADRMGKPFWPQRSEICFNLSHCKGAVACGISKASMGVDVQHFVPYHAGIAKRYSIKAATSEEFTLQWTRVESYGKYTGQGIRGLTGSIPQLTKEGKKLYCRSFPVSVGFLSYTGEEEFMPIEVTLEELVDFLSLLPS